MNYTQSKASSKYNKGTHIPATNTFKLIDLNGTDTQKKQAIDVLSALTRHDAIQILDYQLNTSELYFWVNQRKYADILNNTWAIPVGSDVVRIGPSTYNKSKFHNRNT